MKKYYTHFVVEKPVENEDKYPFAVNFNAKGQGEGARLGTIGVGPFYGQSYEGEWAQNIQVQEIEKITAEQGEMLKNIGVKLRHD